MECASQAVFLRDTSFQAVKVRMHQFTIESDIETIAQIRAAVGPKMVIMVDANKHNPMVAGSLEISGTIGVL